MILETKYGDPPKPSCSIALVALGLKGWGARALCWWGVSMPGLGWGMTCLGMLGAFRTMLASCGSGRLSVWLLWWGSRGGRFSVSGGRRKGLHVLGMAAVLRRWKNACLCGLLDVHQKVRTGCALGPRALAVLCRGCCKESLKKSLMRFDVVMKPQVKAIE